MTDETSATEAGDGRERTAASPDGLGLDARISLLAGADTWHTHAAGDIPAIRMSDGPAGVRGTDWAGPASASFPCGTALGATFDSDLVREVGQALAREARSKSAHVLLGPTVNLQRTPIGGRNFEFFSEDPVHTAAIARAYVEGVQSLGVACCVKHFVGNDSEFARMTVSSEIPERVLREVYFVPFEEVVAAGVRCVMTAYNRLNGTFCSEHDWLIHDVLRGDWGFDGVVVSDWFGTHSTVESLLAGCDIEMPGPPLHRGDRLRAAYDAGDVSDADIDPPVERIRALAAWTGAATTGTKEMTADDPETRSVMRRAAAAGAVLLRNDDGLLPLHPEARVALIGPYAATGRVQGGGSARVTPAKPSAILPALRDHGFVVDHALGCTIDKFLPVLRGRFDVTLRDADGKTVTQPARSTYLLRQHQATEGLDGDFSITITGTFVPDTGGEWQIGLRSVGVATVRFDGDMVVEIGEPLTGGSFFGYGSDEVVGTAMLTAGEPVNVEIESPLAPTGGMRGISVGGRAAEVGDLVGEAAALAARADVAVVVVGTNDEWETEGEDRLTMGLPGRQDELVRAVLDANPNTVVVVNAGSPVSMPWSADVPAILQLWFPGGEIGAALADVLSGDVEPGGRLPVTFPRRLEDAPAFPYYPGDGERAVYGEGLRVGYRHYEAEGVEPLFPFGHGLGFTTFAIEPVGAAGDPAGGIEVTVDVVNTGNRPGSDVLQIYTRYAGGHPGVEPLLRFVASRKVTLPPGDRRRVVVPVAGRALASWLDGGWLVPAGRHRLLVGRSSAALLEAGVVEA